MKIKNKNEVDYDDYYEWYLGLDNEIIMCFDFYEYMIDMLMQNLILDCLIENLNNSK